EILHLATPDASASASARLATSLPSTLTFWPGLSRLTPAVTTDWPGFTPPASSTSLPATPPTATATGCTAPLSITQTEVRPLSWYSADSGTRIAGSAPACASSTTAVIPRRTSSRGGI